MTKTKFAVKMNPACRPHTQINTHLTLASFLPAYIEGPRLIKLIHLISNACSGGERDADIQAVFTARQGYNGGADDG